MRKLKNKRLSLVRATLEGELQKLERRIQTLAEKAYTIRQQMGVVDGLELTRLEKHAGQIAIDILKDAQEREEKQGAILNTRTEGKSKDEPNEVTGGFNISNATTLEAILDEQSKEIYGHCGDIGSDTGSTIRL